MRIITHTCPDCGTIVAANVLEQNRTMKCPGLGCGTILEFDHLSDEEQTYFLRHRDQYEM